MLFFLQQRMSTTETSFKKCACRNWEGFQPRSQMAHEEASCSFPGPATGTRLHLTGKETGGGRALGWMQAAASGRAGLRGHPAGTCPTQVRVSPASPCPLHSPQALGHSWQGLSVGRCRWASLRGSPWRGCCSPVPAWGRAQRSADTGHEHRAAAWHRPACPSPGEMNPR